MALTPAEKADIEATIKDYQTQHTSMTAALGVHHKRVENANKDVANTTESLAALASRIASLQAAIA